MNTCPLDMELVTALGWWFASYEEAILKAQSLGSVVYTS